ncbi:MAG TPA: glycoside hydrolase family 2 TIM barrel-domain containing protein [Chthoniobacteraceae bacterium]|jgi:beta-galactosidase/beta-glucuronidase|nr:glycoside hydrolase family 2 TIM barrel-domain containing protein [Chthoniobacteraceae bacterium]
MKLTASLLILAACAARAGVPVPLTVPGPVPLQKVRVDNPAIVPLAGTWRFQAASGCILADGFHNAAHGIASASSTQGSSPDAVLDIIGGAAGSWTASSGTFPQWWMVDMQQPRQVSGLAVRWEFDTAHYLVKVEGSLDGKSWQLLADDSAMPGVIDGPVALTPARVRYLRLDILGAHRPNTYAWASIRHISIKVIENGAETPWKPVLPPENPATRDAFAQPGLDDKAWAEIPVPANWEMLGFSRPTYNQPDNAVGLYRRWIQIPASFTGKKVLWHFDGVTDGAEIFVNGRPCGYHESGFTAFDIDVTKALEPGRPNLLAVRVTKQTPSVDLDTGDYWCLGGIYRENYLEALPVTHVEDITVITDLDAKYTGATLRADVVVAGHPGATVKLDATLTGADGVPVPGVPLSGAGAIGADGAGIIHLRAPVKAPALWSAEKPNLYFLLFKLADSQGHIERVQQRFGFRKVEIRNGVVLWNGVPLKCTGACRHEEWAAYGHALGEAQWEKDIALMKGANINAVRTSHYNDAERFLELCDEKGLYVLDEVPACWCDVRNPALKPAFLQRAAETLARDKNKACVFAWSLGNESGYGPNNQAMLDYVHAHDSTRPALISQCGPWNNKSIDFADYHYPSFEQVKSIAAGALRKTTPAIFTEQPHIFHVAQELDYDYGVKDFWGLFLARNWSVVWPTDGIVGSFIWEWQDQGIADQFPDHGHDADGLRGNNVKGIVDGYRNPKPEYWEVKMVYSPVTTAAREVTAIDGRFTVPLQNRYDFTNLSELECPWEALAQGRQLASGVSHIACAPRSSVSATFPATAGADTLRLEFIHPDGRSLYATRLHVAGAPWPAPPAALAANGPVQISDASQQVAIAAAGAVLTLDKTTGAVRSWKKGDETLLTGGPILNLGEARAPQGDAKNYLFSKSAPELRNVTVTTARDGDSARAEISGDVFLTESASSVGRLEYTLEVHPDARIDVSWKLDWQAPEVKAWELGMKLILPPQATQMAWSRDGQWTEYPADSIAATDGTASARDLSYRCTKRDIRWVSMSAPGQSGITLLNAGVPVHTRAHTREDATTLFASSAIAPPRDFSTELLPDCIITLKPAQSYTGAFRLQAND